MGNSYSANAPPIFNPAQVPVPGDPTSGRTNNQGLEGLTVSHNGNKLYSLAQSALVQDGGLAKTTNRYARFITYDIKNSPAKYKAEYVVPLPQFNDVGHPPSLWLLCNYFR